MGWGSGGRWKCTRKLRIFEVLGQGGSWMKCGSKDEEKRRRWLFVCSLVRSVSDAKQPD
jgi:hypothetical protein